MNGNGRNGQISDKQEKGINALLACPSLAEASRKAGIGESTLRRWMKQPEFIEAYRDARRQATDQAVIRVQVAMSEAVKCLQDIMADADAPASARVSAARAVLETGFKVVELEDVEERLQALESRLMMK